MQKTDAVIKARNVSKRYLVGHHSSSAERYDTWRDMAGRYARNFGRKAVDMARGRPFVQGDVVEEFWALKDVSFDVSRGEVLGIVGRNGAGKSTLLKILSRITETTEGRIEIRGRVASLLEVGTGFHPELTGRENVFLNGAILGMSRAEIRARFDEIVQFADVTNFLDTPVKRYSSGMAVRLAFAVAAHVDPEILIVDEVLAVGDAEFQKKCLGKMQDVSRRGRTVLFVSHQLAAISALCDSCLLLDNGTVIERGTPAAVLSTYLHQNASESGEVSWTEATAPGGNAAKICRVSILADGRPRPDVPTSAPVTLEMEYEVLQSGLSVSVSFHLLDQLSTCIFATGNLPSASVAADHMGGRPHASGRYISRCRLPANFLNDKTYRVSAFLVADAMSVEAEAPECLTFRAYDDGQMRQEYKGTWIGMLRPRFEWQTLTRGSG